MYTRDIKHPNSHDMFVRLLYQQGIIIFIFFVVMLVVYNYRLCKRKMYFQSFLTSAFLILGLSELRYVEVGFNIVPLLAFSNLEPLEKKLLGMENKEDTRTRNLTLLIRILCFAILTPIMVIWGRTIWTSGKTNLTETQIFVFALIYIVVLYIASGYILPFIRGLKDKTTNLKVVIPLSICTLVLMTQFFMADEFVRSVEGATLSQTVEEETTLYYILGSSEGKVYADALPTIYKNKFSGITFYPLNCEALARDTNVTIITRADFESGMLLANGFLYAQISDDGAVYTNDSSVIRTLDSLYNRPEGYFSYVSKVDLSYQAELNNLSLGYDNAAILQGADNSMKKGPYLTLTTGKYVATYKLSINPEDTRENKRAVTLGIYANKGQTELAKIAVSMSSFDELGECSVELPFVITSVTSENIEFKAVAADGRKIWVNSIEYQKTPDYDTRFVIDKNGNRIKEMYYTLDGEPYALSNGAYGMRYFYDENNNKTELRYLDENGLAANNTSGYAIIFREYDEDNHIVKESYHDADKNLLALSSGQAYVTYEYDEAGNRSSVSYYGIDDEPVLYNNTYWRVEYTYDENKKNIHEVYYGLDGEPALLSDGSCGYDRKYDELGNVIELTYLGTDLNPTLNTSGYATSKRVFNDKKQVIHEEYYGTDGRLIALAAGQMAVDREFDDAGNVTVTTYLGEDMNPVIITSGYARLVRVFNDKKQIVREEYYGVELEPIALSGGQAATEREYDEAGNVVVERYYDVDNNPVLLNGNYFKIKKVFNDLKQNIHEEYYGLDDTVSLLAGGYAGLDREYDEAGNVDTLTHLGLDMNPVMNTSGYSIWRRTYNGKKQVLVESYYDTNGAPIALAGGQWAVAYEYDDNGNKTAIRYYDVDGNPVLVNGQYFYLKMTYDADNQKVSEEQLNIEDGLAEMGARGVVDVLPNATEVSGTANDTGDEAVEDIADGVDAEGADGAESKETSDEDADIPAGISKGDYRIYDPNAKYTSVNEKVTGKKGSVNLRSIPSTEEPSVIVHKLLEGETVVRTGIGENGWSRLRYNGQTVYAVTQYLVVATEGDVADNEDESADAGDTQEEGTAGANSEASKEENSAEASSTETASRSTDPTAYSIAWGTDNKSCTIWSSGKKQGTMTVTDAEGNVKSMIDYGIYYQGSGKNQKKYMNIVVAKGESELSVNADSGFIECLKIMGYSGVYFNKNIINW